MQIFARALFHMQPNSIFFPAWGESGLLHGHHQPPGHAETLGFARNMPKVARTGHFFSGTVIEVQTTCFGASLSMRREVRAQMPASIQEHMDGLGWVHSRKAGEMFSKGNIFPPSLENVDLLEKEAFMDQKYVWKCFKTPSSFHKLLILAYKQAIAWGWGK